MACREIARVLKPGGTAIISDILHAKEYSGIFKAEGLSVEVFNLSFFGEFPLRRAKKIGARLGNLGNAFGNGPRPIVFLRPERPAWMREQDFELWPATKCQEAGADFCPTTHPRNLTLNCGPLPQVLPKGPSSA